MPQTKWFDQATGERIGGISLAERIEAFILPVYGAEGTKFISGESPGLCTFCVSCFGEVLYLVSSGVGWSMLLRASASAERNLC